MKLEDVLKGNNVVNCKNMEEADKLFDATPQLDQIDKPDRQQYNERTAYNPNGFSNGWTYANVEYYEEHGYNIIKFSDIDEFKTALKIGDRVIVNGERSCQYFNNAKGKIITMDSTDYGVEFDDGKDFMHDLGGECKSGRCFYVYKHMVTLDNTIKKEEKKVMNKFKVGDMVKGTERGNNYVYTDKDMTKGKVTKVLDCNEVEVEILEHSSCKRKIGQKYNILSEKFDLITPSKKSIHITFDGDTTHAVVKEDGKVVKREKVGLCRGDVYDEATGVREVIDKLYGKKVVEDIKPKFVKAKVGDTIKIVKALPSHMPDVKNGDTFKITKVTGTYVGNGENSFGDDREEYIIIPSISNTSLNVGDKVKLLDGKSLWSFKGGWTHSMNRDIGKIATIKEVREDGKSVELNEVSWIWDVRCLELVSISTKSISDYTDAELLSEIKRRMEK